MTAWFAVVAFYHCSPHCSTELLLLCLFSNKLQLGEIPLTHCGELAGGQKGVHGGQIWVIIRALIPPLAQSRSLQGQPRLSCCLELVMAVRYLATCNSPAQKA